MRSQKGLRPAKEGFLNMEQQVSHWLSGAERVVEEGTAREVGGVLLDLYSASTMLAVHRALKSPENRARFEEMPLVKAHKLAFTLAAKVRGQ